MIDIIVYLFLSIVCVWIYCHAEDISKAVFRPLVIKNRNEYINTVLVDMDRIGKEIIRNGLWEELKEEWFDSLQIAIGKTAKWDNL